MREVVIKASEHTGLAAAIRARRWQRTAPRGAGSPCRRPGRVSIDPARGPADLEAATRDASPGRSGAGGRRPTGSCRRRSAGRPGAAAGRQADPGADGVAVRARSLRAGASRSGRPVGPVVEVGQGLVLRRRSAASTRPSLSRSPDGQAAADARDRPGRPGRGRRRRSAGPPAPPSEELRGHRVGERRAGSR